MLLALLLFRRLCTQGHTCRQLLAAFAPLQALHLIAGLSTLAVPLAAGDRYLLFGSDQEQMKAQFLKFFSAADWEANQRMQVRSPEGSI